jgi:hypothetical protein
MSTIDKSMTPDVQITPHMRSDKEFDLEGVAQPQTSHTEIVEKSLKSAGKSHEHDTAMALFDSTDDLQEGFDPQEIRQLRRKIDMLIMPCLLICFSFFYIDKVSPKIWLGIQLSTIAFDMLLDHTKLRSNLWHDRRPRLAKHRI